MVGTNAETDRLHEFIRFASSKAAMMQYFTETDKTGLIVAGEGFGLSKSLVEAIVKSTTANNPLMLKKLADKVKDLKNAKQILLVLGVKPSDHQSILKSSANDKTANTGLAAQSEAHDPVQNQAFLDTHHST